MLSDVDIACAAFDGDHFAEVWLPDADATTTASCWPPATDRAGQFTKRLLARQFDQDGAGACTTQNVRVHDALEDGALGDVVVDLINRVGQDLAAGKVFAGAKTGVMKRRWSTLSDIFQPWSRCKRGTKVGNELDGAATNQVS